MQSVYVSRDFAKAMRKNFMYKYFEILLKRLHAYLSDESI